MYYLGPGYSYVTEYMTVYGYNVILMWNGDSKWTKFNVSGHKNEYSSHKKDKSKQKLHESRINSG